MESSDMPEIENSDEHVHDDDVEAVFRTKDHRVISLLFGIRTEILGLAKKVESTNKHVEDIHTRLLEPDEGLFARVRDLEKEVKSVKDSDEEVKEAIKTVENLMNFKSWFTKIAWFFGATTTGVIIKYIFDQLVIKK